jgi:hypothetical protein
VNSGPEFAFKCSVTLRAYMMRLPYDANMSFTAITSSHLPNWCNSSQLVQRTRLYYICQVAHS